MILDEPENDDYKQDELAPRYDARLVAAWCAEHAGTSMETFGLTNPLGTDALIPTISLPLHIHVRHPQGRSVIPMIQADTLNLMREHTGPLVVIHPIRGMSARLVCRDCGWQAVCAHCGFGLSAEADHAICRQCGKKSDMPIACASCGGTDLGKSLPGIEKLKTAWKKHEPNLSIEWRNLTNETMDASLPANAMIVVTDGSLLGGVTEDVRRRERQCIAFRRLASRAASAHGSLIIQSDESMIALWNQWLSGEGVQRFHAEELKQRKAFRYPPAVRLVKILIDETETVAKTWLERAQKTFGNDAEYHGPFPVPYRPTSRKQRFVCHLIFDRQINERDLIARLKPLAASVIMDLDPIAFFK
jgi:primosomal protein N'